MNLRDLFINSLRLFRLDRKLDIDFRTPMAHFLAGSFEKRSHEPDFEKVKARLLEPLDAAGRALVETILERHHYIYTNNVLKLSRTFSPAELEAGQKETAFMKKCCRELGLPFEKCEVSSLYFHHGLRHTGLSRELVARLNGGSVMDVGAFLGDSAYVFEKFYHPAGVHSFEMPGERFATLQANIARWDLKKVHGVPLALSAEPGMLEDGTPATSIDDYVRETGLSVGLIKMDVEGAEELVLRGGMKTIAAQKPLLIVSMYHNGRQFFDLLPFIQSINPDYHFHILKLDDTRPVYEITLFCI